MKKPGRNDPCSCGSGKRFKQCCGILRSESDIAHHVSAEHKLEPDGGKYEIGQTIQRYQDIRVNEPLQLYQMGNALAMQGRYDQAVIYYERALSLKPDYAEVHNNLGNIFSNRGNLEEAIRSYRRALELNPSFMQACYNLGIALNKQGKVDEAVENFRQVIRLAPDNAAVHISLASALLTLGRRDEALSCFQDALRINPDSGEARYFISVLGGAPTLAHAPEDYVKTMFDDYAERFDWHLVKRLGYRIPELLREAVSQTLETGRVGLDVLDLGCGTGLCGPLFRDIAKVLTGIDLSTRMIEKARDKGVYDELLIGDITSDFRRGDQTFDLIISADVFIYIGELQTIFMTCAAALRPGGLFVFSTEAAAGDTYVLQPTARYAHSESYIRRLASASGFTVLRRNQDVHRRERGTEINGYVFVLRREV